MKKKIILSVVAVIVLSLAYYFFFYNSGKKSKGFVSAQITRGDVAQTILSTGTLQAVSTVEVGTQVSGRIVKLFVDFNDKVKKGQLLAIVDTTNLVTQVHDAKTNLEKSKADYHQAILTQDKDSNLYVQHYISELDYVASQTNVESAYAAMKTAQSALERAKTNLGYAYIYAPISGKIQDRAIEQGQTVAASLSAPTLFTIAEDLSHMKILASVDEGDIGEIALGQKVDFTVQAYPDKRFWGQVVQIRINSTVVSNVVNYTVVVNADNADDILLPGMTATVDFYIQERDSVLLVPNAALRFNPTDDILAEYKSDAGKSNSKQDSLKTQQQSQSNSLSKDKVKKSQYGHIWYLDAKQKLQMSSVVLGITDGKFTEIISDRKIFEGMQVITGIIDGTAAKSTTTQNSLMNPTGNMQQRGGRRGM
jgi:HlyD family secretion protein